MTTVLGVEWRTHVGTQSREEKIQSSSGDLLQESNESDVNPDSERKNGPVQGAAVARARVQAGKGRNLR